MTTVDDARYWEDRYQQGDTPWDLAEPAPELVAWLAAHPGSGERAFNPGCGAGHDAVALAAAGYATTALDFSASAVDATRMLAGARGVTLEAVEADLFAYQPAAPFDLWVEHTCFCAIDPAMRPRYVEAAAKLVKPGGLLLAVFFTHGEPGGPPFDVQRAEIEALFSSAFAFEHLAVSTRSLARRAGEETLGLLRRKA